MGICAVHSQMHHTMGERVRLARSRPRNDKERTIGVASAFVDAVFDGTALINVELFKIGGGHRAGESLGWRALRPETMFLVRSQLTSRCHALFFVRGGAPIRERSDEERTRPDTFDSAFLTHSGRRLCIAE